MQRAANKVKQAANKYNNPLLIQSVKQFGDVLHASMVVNHYNHAFPSRKILWIISENYLDAFKYHEGCDIIGVPHQLSMDDRRQLLKELQKNYDIICPLCGISGWAPGVKNIASAVLNNAGIKKLSVPRKTILNIGEEDIQWAKEFKEKHKLPDDFITLEYYSYTLSQPPHNATWSINKYNKFLSKINYRTVFIASDKEPKLSRGVDARGCTWRQAKALIKSSKAFVGCGSGLTMVAASNNMNTPIFEINIGDSISMKGCGYFESCIIKGSPPDTADKLNKYLGMI